MVVAVNHLVNKSSLKRKSFCVAKPNCFSVSFATNKRVCISPSVSRRNSAALYSSSSSDENDDDSDNETGYINNQRRARKRAFSTKRSSSFTDVRLCHAISKYSDVEDDEDDNDLNKKPKINDVTSSTNKSDIDTRSHSGSISGSSLFFSDARSSIKRSSLEQDQIARNRCFDYLVGAIDEAWARYCDATSYAEEEAYKDYDYLPNTPASLGPSEFEDDDEEDEDDEESEQQQQQQQQQQQTQQKSDTEEFDITSKPLTTPTYSSDVELRSGSSHPGPVRLQQLKDRLLKAKYYLQEYLDTTEAQDAITFWRRWDLVKYATIELVEDDDDDEIIETTIDDLERGRLYGCF